MINMVTYHWEAGLEISGHSQDEESQRGNHPRDASRANQRNQIQSYQINQIKTNQIKSSQIKNKKIK